MKSLIIIFGLLLLATCSQKTTRVLTVSVEKKLIPEGIAVNKNQIFISSIFKEKIIQYDLKTEMTTDFISTNEYGFKSGVGLFVKDSLLFALTNSSIKRNEIANPMLYVFSIPSKKLLKMYNLADKESHFWNDLTVDTNYQVFITDTQQNKIYKIKYPNDKIESFYTDSTTILPNGIDLSSDGSKLFIASTEYGMRILDIQSRKILNKVDNETVGIDGLKYYKGNLFAIKNTDIEHSKHRLLKILLSKDEEFIEKVEEISVRNDLWNVPTTLDIHNDFVYLLANSQMDNLNQDKLEIIDIQTLTNTYVLKFKIK